MYGNQTEIVLMKSVPPASGRLLSARLSNFLNVPWAHVAGHVQRETIQNWTKHEAVGLGPRRSKHQIQ